MGINNELRKNINTAIQSTGASLYDIEVSNEGGHNYLRVFIQNKDGVSLGLCEEISRLISPLIDVHDPLGGRYFFEVSSPGIERSLKNESHFVNSIGEKVKITLKDKTKIIGELLSYSEQNGTLDINVDGETKQYLLSDIIKARTYFEWK